MKTLNTGICLLAAGTVLAGCATKVGGTSTAPYASVYNAAYASAAANVISEKLVNPGDKLESGAATADESFGDPSTRSLNAPGKIEIEKAADGYTLRYAGEEVAFTNADLQSGSFYEKMISDSGGNPRSMGYLFATVFGTTPEALTSSDSAMVPVGFGIRTNSTGEATANESDGYSNGFSVVGLETDPSDMPKTGMATYQGYGRIDAYNKEVDYNTAGSEERLSYRGQSTLNADFGAGQISGRIDLMEKRRRTVAAGGGSDETQTDISGQGAAVLLDSAAIVQNGFSSDLSLNDAAAAGLATDGVSADTEAVAVGRFYGPGADEVGAVVAGEGSSHVITGIVTGYEQP